MFCVAGNDVLTIWRVKSDDFLTFVIFRFVFHYLCIVYLTEWYALFPKATSYSTFAELKLSLLNELLDSLFAVDVG